MRKSTVKTLYDIKSKRKMKSVLQRATQLGSLSMSFENQTHYITNIMKNTCFDQTGKENLVLLETNMDFSKVALKNKSNGKYFKKMDCGYYEKANNNQYYFYEWNLFDSINHFMKMRKTIYIILDVANYLTYIYSTPKPTYAHHCLILIFHYNNIKQIYEMKIINPHGKDTKTYHDYLFILKGDKVKKYHHDDIVDVSVLKEFLSILRKTIRKKISYDFKNDTYMGANLQAGDNYGICFIFPILIWYNLGIYYNTDQQIKTVNIGTMKKMLETDSLDIMVQSILANFTKQIQDVFIKNIRKNNLNEILNDYLVKKGNYLTKTMLQKVIGFMGQKAIISQIR